jgi:hypothetical protein
VNGALDLFVSRKCFKAAIMDVQVKLYLQGGHAWEFCCDEDDPVVFGLVSALPGADAGANLPSDGLVQVEAQSGERLFLSRSSLVSVEIIPITDEMAFRGVRRIAPSSFRLPESMATPSPFVLVPDALPGECIRALIEQALAQENSGAVLNAGQRGARELEFGGLEGALAQAFGLHLEKSRVALGVSGDPVETRIDFRLLAIGDGGAVDLDRNSDDLLCFVHHFYRQPKGFTGGGMRLFDGALALGARRAIGSFRDVDIADNALLIFPGQVVNAGLPVRREGLAFADRLFTVCGALRRGPK